MELSRENTTAIVDKPVSLRFADDVSDAQIHVDTRLGPLVAKYGNSKKTFTQPGVWVVSGTDGLAGKTVTFHRKGESSPSVPSTWGVQLPADNVRGKVVKLVLRPQVCTEGCFEKCKPRCENSCH